MKIVLKIENDGGLIKSTNFFQSEMAQKGFFYLSINARTIRILIPSIRIGEIVREIRSTHSFEIEKRFLPANQNVLGLVIWFVDGSENPYCLQLGPGSFDRLYLDSDRNNDVNLLIYDPKLKIIYEGTIKLL